MHWFRRATIAVVMSCLYGALAITVLKDAHEGLAEYFASAFAFFGYRARPESAFIAAVLAPAVTLGLATLVLLIRCPSPAGKAIKPGRTESNTLANKLERVDKVVRVHWLPRSVCIVTASLCYPVFLVCFGLLVDPTFARLVKAGILKPSVQDDFVALFVMFFLVFLLAFLPCRFVFYCLRWRWVRWDGSHCLDCGYNLTGNASGVCPECGTET